MPQQKAFKSSLRKVYRRSINVYRFSNIWTSQYLQHEMIHAYYIYLWISTNSAWVCIELTLVNQWITFSQWPHKYYYTRQDINSQKSMNWFWAEIEIVLCDKYITFLHWNCKSGIIWCINHKEVDWPWSCSEPGEPRFDLRFRSRFWHTTEPNLNWGSCSMACWTWT